MTAQFYNLVENLKHLKLDDKLYLKEIFDRIIIDDKRNMIKKNAANSRDEYKAGKIKFGTADDMKKLMYES